MTEEKMSRGGHRRCRRSRTGHAKGRPFSAGHVIQLSPLPSPSPNPFENPRAFVDLMLSMTSSGYRGPCITISYDVPPYYLLL